MKHISEKIVVQSSGESLEIGLKESKHPLFTVIDSRGWIVRALTQWLSTMRSGIGLSRAQGTVEQYGRAVSYLARWLECHEDFEGMSVIAELEKRVMSLLDQNAVLFEENIRLQKSLDFLRSIQKEARPKAG